MNDISTMVQEVIAILPAYPTMYAACVQVVGNSGVPWQQLADAVVGEM